MFMNLPNLMAWELFGASAMATSRLTQIQITNQSPGSSRTSPELYCKILLSLHIPVCLKPNDVKVGTEMGNRNMFRECGMFPKWLF